MVIDYKAIGKRIKIARLKYDVTQSMLSDRTGLSIVHLSNIENGNAKMSLTTIISIANALSVSVDEFLCDNVVHSNHIFIQEAQDLLSTCSPYEVRFLLDILKASKEALDKNNYLQQNTDTQNKEKA